MNTTRMVIFLVLATMSVVPVFTALYDGSFTSDGEQKLDFPMSYHYEALYGNIFFINAANYLVLGILPQTIPWYAHAVIYAACLEVSRRFHKSWAPLSGDKPKSHFFKKTDYNNSSCHDCEKDGWWKSFSAAGWLHLFLFPAALTMFLEWAIFAWGLSAQTTCFIVLCYIGYWLTAVMGYHTAMSHAELKLNYDKLWDLGGRALAIIAVTAVKLWFR